MGSVPHLEERHRSELKTHLPKDTGGVGAELERVVFGIVPRLEEERADEERTGERAEFEAPTKVAAARLGHAAFRELRVEPADRRLVGGGKRDEPRLRPIVRLRRSRGQHREKQDHQGYSHIQDSLQASIGRLLRVSNDVREYAGTRRSHIARL